RRHTRFSRDWSSDVCSSDLEPPSTVSIGSKDENSQLEPTPQPSERTISEGSGASPAPRATASVQFHSHSGMLQAYSRSPMPIAKIGRASCRERVYSGVADES